MARIRVLEAVAGDDFSWRRGDVVDLPDEVAAGWADGHRAEWADGDETGGATARPYELPPRVVTAEGVELEVVQAVVETVPDPTAEPESPDPVRWSVTVALPEPVPAADVVADAGGTAGVSPAADGASPSEDGVDPARDGDVPELRDDGFDPITHNVKDVLAYLAGADGQEAMRVLDLEGASENPRKGITRERDTILQQARDNDADRELAASGEQLAAEKAADVSRGGGRGDGIETR